VTRVWTEHDSGTFYTVRIATYIPVPVESSVVYTFAYISQIRVSKVLIRIARITAISVTHFSNCPELILLIIAHPAVSMRTDSHDTICRSCGRGRDSYRMHSSRNALVYQGALVVHTLGMRGCKIRRCRYRDTGICTHHRSVCDNHFPTTHLRCDYW